ncbi:MAG: hypothetical protein WC391_08050 [Methanoregula sp.]|jgi:hypothetical protein
MGKKRSRRYIWKVVIGFGFLSGLWTAIGIDPEDILLSALENTADAVYPSPTLRYLFLLLPTLLLIVSIFSAYKEGKLLGLVSVVVAYISGLFIIARTEIAVILLCGAVLLGFLSTNPRMRRRILNL